MSQSNNFRQRRSTKIIVIPAILCSLLGASIANAEPSGFTDQPYIRSTPASQSIDTSAVTSQTFARDGYQSTSPEELAEIKHQAEMARLAEEKRLADIKSAADAKSKAAPAAGIPDPGSAKEIARLALIERGWGDDEYNCLVALWSKESGWNTFAHNTSSGAYGIPQALPGNKMASAGADWQTNPATQIAWGLGYISGRYSTPCGAWEQSQSVGWY